MREGGGEGTSGITAVRRDDQGVVPVQAEPGEGQRHRRGGRDDPWLDAAGAQGADDAEEARVAGGQHRYGTRARVDGFEGLVEMLELYAFGAGRDRDGGQVPGRADDLLRRSEGL